MLTILHCLPYTSFRGYATNKGIFTSLCAAGLLEGVSPDLQPYVPHAHTRGSQTLHVLGVRQRLLSQLRPEKARPETPRRNPDPATPTARHLAPQASPLADRAAPGAATGWARSERVRPWSVLPSGGGVRPGWGPPRPFVGWRWGPNVGGGTACGATAWNPSAVGGSCGPASQQSGDGVSGRKTTLSSDLVVDWITLLLLLLLPRQGTKVCRYIWHSAGSLHWPFPMLIYKYIFQTKIYGNSYIKQYSETVMF